MDLSIVLPVLNERRNIEDLLRSILRILTRRNIRFEIIVVDGRSKDGTAEAARAFGEPVFVLVQELPGYAEALRLGFKRALGDFIITLDADLSHNPLVIPRLWNKRHLSDIVIASRYVPRGGADMPWLRYVLSRLLNLFVSTFLDLPFKDLSSGFRLYKASVIKNTKPISSNFEVLEEILIEAFANGYRISEVPMVYRPRKEGKSKARLIRFAISFVQALGKMWRLRNSIECGDYDDRAYDSRIWFQRFWQRTRVGIVHRWASSNKRLLDIGCGSSRLISLLSGGIFMDVAMHKLRYARKFSKPLVNGSIWNLPFADHQFDCVVCSEVIEHIPAGDEPFNEIKRVLKPGGKLILGTPDYGPPTWRMIEAIYGKVAPGAYAHEHITHYTQDSLRKLIERLGFEVLEIKYVLNADMFFLCRLKG